MSLRQLAIPRGSFSLAADLHLPDDFDPAERHRAVVLATPGSSVKEQIGANYAARLARNGLVALAFDPAYQGQSGGEPRDLEDPYQRGEDISFAVDALSTVAGVDPDRIGVLGICAGAGYAVHTARTDHRIKAVGTVVPSDIGEAFRGSGFSPDGAAVALDGLAASRAKEVTRGELVRVKWLPAGSPAATRCCSASTPSTSSTSCSPSRCRSSSPVAEASPAPTRRA